MEPSYESSDNDAVEMAAVIGFSSFGTQGQSKKRKFNPKCDAYIEGGELAAVDKGGKKGQGSGGNQIPLGRSRTFGVPSEASVGVAKNEEEIPLDDDEGPQYIDEDGEAPTYLNTNHTPPVIDRIERNEDVVLLDRDGEERGPRYVDTSLPPPNDAARMAQEKIDAILAATESFDSDASGTRITGKQKQPKKAQGEGLGVFMAALKTRDVAPSSSDILAGTGTIFTQQIPPGVSLPQHPQPASPNTRRLAERSVTGSQRSGQKGQKNDPWYVGYYDLSFNQNPWKSLEQINGLPEVGTWIERPQRPQS